MLAGDRTFLDELLRPALREVWIRLLVAALAVLLWRARLARRRFHLLWSALDAAPDGVQITNLDGTIAYSNRAVQDIYGFTPRELQGRHVNELNVGSDHRDPRDPPGDPAARAAGRGSSR